MAKASLFCASLIQGLVIETDCDIIMGYRFLWNEMHAISPENTASQFFP